MISPASPAKRFGRLVGCGFRRARAQGGGPFGTLVLAVADTVVEVSRGGLGWASGAVMDNVADVISQGRDEPRSRRRFLPVLLVAAIAGATLLVILHDHARPGSAASASGQPAARGSARPWPSDRGACGNSADLPLLATRPLREPTGLSVLVGGAGLRLVSVDSGVVRPISGVGGVAGRSQVTQLTESAAGIHALAVGCDPVLPPGRVLAVNAPRRTVTAVLNRRVDMLLSAPDMTWAGVFGADPGSQQMVLYPVDGASQVVLPLGFGAFAATSRELIGELPRPGAPADVEAVALSRVDTNRIRPLGEGVVIAAAGQFVLTSHGCDETLPCVITRGAADGGTRQYAMPSGRGVASGVVLSRDGRYVAFQLSRARPDRRYDVGHPWPPSDIAVQDLVSGRLCVVPGVELPPKSLAGLAFSRDGRWLIIALNAGRSTRLVLWRRGLSHPYESPARLPGAVLYDVPVLDITAAAN